MGRPTNSLIGQRFGRLVVIERAENTENRQTKWLCQCDCGHTCVAYGINLKAGRKVNCGDCVGEDMNKEQMRQTSASLDRLRKDGEVKKFPIHPSKACSVNYKGMEKDESLPYIIFCVKKVAIYLNKNCCKIFFKNF